jgi:dTDP-4-amino-4,6-dideoxygalactose transaminase
MKNVAFHVPLVTGKEAAAVAAVLGGAKFSGNGPVGKQVESNLEGRFSLRRCMLTASCTAALEMSALLLEIRPGDEVVLPSFTFVTTASAFAARGARLKFVDIRPDTLNIDETKLEAALTDKTRAIVPVHYGGVAAEMDSICALASERGIPVVEDAAQGVMARYKGRQLGGIGDLGCWSFHDTKNFHCGEGGALVVNDERLVSRAEIVREKGTDRCRFLRGEVDKYTWRELGSSFLLGELSAAFLSGQLGGFREYTDRRLRIWDVYHSRLQRHAEGGRLQLPTIPADVEHNAHIFYLITQGPDARDRLSARLRERGVATATHYLPLHASPCGQKCGSFVGEDRHTTRVSERLLRLPLHGRLTEADAHYVCDAVDEALC